MTGGLGGVITPLHEVVNLFLGQLKNKCTGRTGHGADVCDLVQQQQL